ncbi:hypothetical protein [Cryptosporangium phraense]|uniref:Uncharacterized protein n=1 Tax=Cryptosporangium phraense TaxID=2593070 RepID=A0A545B0J1_9ACTN|nr:hypothetical protein [Cryptosporangium phraense]TQS47078.1 hypothetical protein FL583_02115 [Cryptosporangium phraense]
MNEHQLTIEARASGEVLFVCSDPDCGRRFVVSRRTGLTVLEQGDFSALHSGGEVAAQVRFSA